jgi:hypothetical protein
MDNPALDPEMVQQVVPSDRREARYEGVQVRSLLHPRGGAGLSGRLGGDRRTAELRAPTPLGLHQRRSVGARHRGRSVRPRLSAVSPVRWGARLPDLRQPDHDPADERRPRSHVGISHRDLPSRIHQGGVRRPDRCRSGGRADRLRGLAQNGKSDVVVARSADFGTTWTVVVADRVKAGTDKPILAVRGRDVYVAYNHAQKIWVSSSHDGGATFTSVNVNKQGKLGWALASGGTVDPTGNVYFGWSGYERNGGAKGMVHLFVSRSSDRGATWTNTVVDDSSAPPDCSEFLCGWAYLGAQLALTSDA